jgi:hypothetical protein
MSTPDHITVSEVSLYFNNPYNVYTCPNTNDCSIGNKWRVLFSLRIPNIFVSSLNTAS